MIPKPTLYRPASGRRVLHPNGQPLDASGEPIALTPYWRRLLAAGDIEPVPAPRNTQNTSKSAPPAADDGSKSE